MPTDKNGEVPYRASSLTPGISGARGPLMIKGKLDARPLHAVVMLRADSENVGYIHNALARP